MNKSTLHIFSKPVSEIQYQEVMALMGADDALLFTRDACYSLLAPFIDINKVTALQTDCEARGMVKTPGLSLIDYSAWVDLTLEHKNSLSW